MQLSQLAFYLMFVLAIVLLIHKTHGNHDLATVSGNTFQTIFSALIKEKGKIRVLLGSHGSCCFP